MDAKALAKSKRAHSQHHSKKYHPNHKAKTPSPVDGGRANDAGTTKKPLPPGKQVKEKTHPTQGGPSALPSNWDRYEEEFDEDPTGDGPNRALDVVLPRSKGADYRHLIAEAQSESQVNIYSDTFPCLDNVLSGDWNNCIGSMLSVRGESILSRIGDDNFVVEDKAAAHNEVSFLSLNLHALAEQLEKIDLPQRLFIEADLLPPELLAEGLEATCSRSSDQMQATCSDFSENVMGSDHDIEIAISGSPGSGHLDPTLPNLGSVSVSQGNIDPSKLGTSDYQSKLPESKTQVRVESFEASTAEAELDMLLDSFGETTINDSSGFRSGNTFSVNLVASVAPIQLPRKAPDSSVLTTSNLDDVLDDLINQSGPSQDLEERAAHDLQSSSHSGKKSKEMGDFDSWLDTI